MQTARRRQTSWAVTASVIAHLAVVVVLLSQRPTLRIPDEQGSPPPAIIPVLLMPRTPPPSADKTGKPAPIQLHRRAQRAAPIETPVAPLVIPTPKAAPPPPAGTAGPVTLRELAQPLQPSADAVRATLRATLGCTELRLASLSREERQGCLGRLGRGAHDEAYLAPALSAEKRALLAEAGDAKLAQKAAAERPLTANPLTPPPADYDGEPITGGAGESALGKLEHKPSKRAARVLAPLRP